MIPRQHPATFSLAKVRAEAAKISQQTGEPLGACYHRAAVLRGYSSWRDMQRVRKEYLKEGYKS